MLMPLRLRLSGLQRCGEVDSSDAKPPTVRRQSVSTPPAIGRVAQAEVEQAPRREQCLRARGARGGDGIGGAARAEQARGERRGRADLLLLVGKPGREGAVLDLRRHRVLAGSDARGAGADDDGDALRAVARERRVDRGADLRRRRGEQAVVAAVVLRKRRGQRRELAHHAADAGRPVG